MRRDPIRTGPDGRARDKAGRAVSGAGRVPPWKALGGLMLLGGLFLAERELFRSRRRRRACPDDAPPRAQTRLLARPFAAASALTDIPRDRILAFWRDPANLPRLVGRPSAVAPQPDGSFVWTLGRGAERLRLHLRLREDPAGEALVWESPPGAEIAAEARLALRDAPGGRGTLVSAEIRRPAGLGAGEAEAELREALRRFRMLVEAGEIAVAAPLPGEAPCAP